MFFLTSAIQVPSDAEPGAGFSCEYTARVHSADYIICTTPGNFTWTLNYKFAFTSYVSTK